MLHKNSGMGRIEREQHTAIIGEGRSVHEPQRFFPKRLGDFKLKGLALHLGSGGHGKHLSEVGEGDSGFGVWRCGDYTVFSE